MLKENLKTLGQINDYIRRNTPTVFSRQYGKSGMLLKMMQINYGLELYKDVVKNANEYISFEQVLINVGDAIYNAYKESECGE